MHAALEDDGEVISKSQAKPDSTDDPNEMSVLTAGRPTGRGLGGDASRLLKLIRA